MSRLRRHQDTTSDLFPGLVKLTDSRLAEIIKSDEIKLKESYSLKCKEMVTEYENVSIEDLNKAKAYNARTDLDIKFDEDPNNKTKFTPVITYKGVKIDTRRRQLEQLMHIELGTKDGDHKADGLYFVDLPCELYQTGERVGGFIKKYAKDFGVHKDTQNNLWRITIRECGVNIKALRILIDDIYKKNNIPRRLSSVEYVSFNFHDLYSFGMFEIYYLGGERYYFNPKARVART